MENNKKINYFKTLATHLLAGVIIAGLFSVALYVFANPSDIPPTPYGPGETLNPTCAPGSTDCTVMATVPYTGATGNLNLGAHNYITTGLGNFGSLSSDNSHITSDGSGNLTANTFIGSGSGLTGVHTSLYAGLTGSMYNGSFASGSDIGYQAANDLCNIAWSGSHMCSTAEILNTIAVNLSLLPASGTAWIANGPPGYLANANDCIGHTSSAASDIGSFWNFAQISSKTTGGAGWLIACSNSKYIACCK